MTDSGDFYVGYAGSGTLSITNGGSVSNPVTYIGYNSGATGAVALSGAGATWSTGATYVGYNGTGTVTVDGAALSCSSTISMGSGGTFIVTNVGSVNATSSVGISGITRVNGSGSNLNTGSLSLASGSMSINDGASASASAVTVDSASILTMDVGTGSTLTVGGGSGTLTYSGVLRFTAGADAASGAYTPIKAGLWLREGNWQGTGSAEVVGGVWNPANHTVTVNSAITTTAGTAATMDLYVNQRGIVTDPSTGKSVGLGFQATATSNPITFSATAIGGSELSSLQTLIGTGNSVLSGWSFTTTGTTISSTNPVYLSLTAGAGQSLYSLSVYDFNGTSWSQLNPMDLAYDGNYASFTAFNLNDVAVVGAATPTPIPAAVWLLGSGLLGLVGLKRKQNLTV